MAFPEFAHILWETTKPTIGLTDNESVTRFFETKANPPVLWNECDYIMKHNIEKHKLPAHSTQQLNF